MGIIFLFLTLLNHRHIYVYYIIFRIYFLYYYYVVQIHFEIVILYYENKLFKRRNRVEIVDCLYSLEYHE